MASKRRAACASLNTRLRMRAMSSEPSGASAPGPNCAAIAPSAAPPRHVSERATASVSITSAPSEAKISAAAFLPLPMPSVSPIR